MRSLIVMAVVALAGCHSVGFGSVPAPLSSDPSPELSPLVFLQGQRVTLTPVIDLTAPLSRPLILLNGRVLRLDSLPDRDR